jgi:hypothetical protein
VGGGRYEVAENSLSVRYRPFCLADLRAIPFRKDHCMTTPLTQLDKRRFANALELKLRRCRGDMLQEFLGALMSKVHGDNFVPASAAYSRGDLKCDGLLNEPLTIFACYGATNGGDGQTRGALAIAVAKVGTDFVGAVANWPGLKEWHFVNNYVDGAPPQITAKILELGGVHSDRVLRQMGKAQFRRLIEPLGLEVVEDLLGEAASEEDFRNLQLPEIQALMNGLMARTTGRGISDDVPKNVPEKKLVFNNLSPVSQYHIRQGLRNAAGVEQYLSDHPVPTYSQDIAKIFKGKYEELKTQGIPPDYVLDDLYEFILGGQKDTGIRQVATWNLLAHLFEKCTIFEDLPVAAAAI